MTSLARPARYGLIGYPVSHSVSPAMFGAAFEALSFRTTYTAVAIPPQGLAQGVARLVSEGYLGFNVTVPHKISILSLLDQSDPTVRAVGAANVVTVTGKGLTGFNTDVGGFAASLAPLGVPDLSEGTVLLLGAGGAARAVMAALLRFHPRKVIVVNRGLTRAEGLIRSFSPAAGDTVVESVRPDLLAALPDLAASRLLIQATSLGLKETDPLPLDPAVLPEGCFVYDLAYGPRSTELVRRAAARGLATADGREMLLRQAVEAFRIWFGTEPPIEAMRSAMSRELLSCRDQGRLEAEMENG